MTCGNGNLCACSDMDNLIITQLQPTLINTLHLVYSSIEECDKGYYIVTITTRKPNAQSRYIPSAMRSIVYLRCPQSMFA